MMAFSLRNRPKINITFKNLNAFIYDTVYIWFDIEDLQSNEEFVREGVLSHLLQPYLDPCLSVQQQIQIVIACGKL